MKGNFWIKKKQIKKRKRKLWSEKYYPKFGYVPAIEFMIEAHFTVNSENFIAKKLQENAPKIQGTIKYAKESGI